MNFEHSAKTKDYLARLNAFMDKHLWPAEQEIVTENHRLNSGGDWTQWQTIPAVEAMKQKARDEGLWNLFLPDADLAEGLSCLDYAPLAEQMGRCVFAPEVFNCNAPDTGNMEVLYHFGNEQQQAPCD